MAGDPSLKWGTGYGAHPAAQGSSLVPDPAGSAEGTEGDSSPILGDPRLRGEAQPSTRGAPD